MKLAKKMLASVLALALVAALALTAFAANAAVVITADKKAVNVGDQVTFTVSGSNIAGLESGDLVFTYNAEVLEYVSSSVLYPDFDLKTVNGNETGIFRFSFAYLENATADNAFVSVTFKAIATGEAEFAYVVPDGSDENGSWNGIDAPAAAADKVVVEVPTTAAPTTAATTAAPTEPASADETKPAIDQTGDVGVAAIAGVMAIAAVAFVATRKKDEE